MAEKLLTPQQEKFLYNYKNPNSPMFGNAYRSAMDAGYTDEYASVITANMPAWLSENIRDDVLLEKAEKALLEAVSFEIRDAEGKVDAAIARIKADVSKFVAETVGKAKYSKKTETESTVKVEIETISPEDKQALLSLLNDKGGTN